VSSRRRPKASEIFQGGPYVFSKPGISFEEVFPSVEDVTVELTETGEGTFGAALPESSEKRLLANSSIVIIRFVSTADSRSDKFSEK